MHVKNKIAIITGAGKGLGEDTARVLAAEGAKVIVCSRNKNDLIKVCHDISSKGGYCEYSVVDVTSESKVNKFIDQIIKRHKKIDIIINNAGYVNKWEPIEKNTPEDFDACFKTNLYSIFYFMKKALPIMKKQKEGAIINISSFAGKRGVPNIAAYSASKFAVIGLTQSVAKESKESNIYCISVCPGGMDTQMRVKLLGNEDAHKQQSPEFVAGVIRDILVGKTKVPNGGDIVIRHGEITSINEAPE